MFAPVSYADECFSFLVASKGYGVHFTLGSSSGMQSILPDLNGIGFSSLISHVFSPSIALNIHSAVGELIAFQMKT